MFGSPDQPDSSQSNCSHNPPPVVMMTSSGWQHLGDGVWVFAAYCSGGGQLCSHVTAVGVMQDLDTAETVLQCALWYEESPQHLQGLLSVSTDRGGVTTFTCESKYPNKTPYAVAIYKGKGKLIQTNNIICFLNHLIFQDHSIKHRSSNLLQTNL